MSQHPFYLTVTYFPVFTVHSSHDVTQGYLSVILHFARLIESAMGKSVDYSRLSFSKFWFEIESFISSDWYCNSPLKTTYFYQSIKYIEHFIQFE